MFFSGPFSLLAFARFRPDSALTDRNQRLSDATIRSGDAGGEQRYLESERTKESGERSVKFVAEAAAPFVNDLVKESIFVTDDFAAEVDVEVFKGHREEVGAMDFS